MAPPWGSSMELKPNWLLKPQKTFSVAHFYLLKLSVFLKKNCVLEASGLDFEGPGPRFWRLSAPTSNYCQPENISIKGGGLIEMFFIVCGLILAPEQVFFRRLPAKSTFPHPFLPSPIAWQSSNLLAHKRGRRRWSPLGGFNGIGSKMGQNARQKLSCMPMIAFLN